jgi:hypothetical protein
MEYLGAWGTLIHEKNLKSKTSCQTPFKTPDDLKVLYIGKRTKISATLFLKSKFKFNSYVSWKEGK